MAALKVFLSTKSVSFTSTTTLVVLDTFNLTTYLYSTRPSLSFGILSPDKSCPIIKSNSLPVSSSMANMPNCFILYSSANPSLFISTVNTAVESSTVASAICTLFFSSITSVRYSGLLLYPDPVLAWDKCKLFLLVVSLVNKSAPFSVRMYSMLPLLLLFSQSCQLLQRTIVYYFAV